MHYPLTTLTQFTLIYKGKFKIKLHCYQYFKQMDFQNYKPLWELFDCHRTLSARLTWNDPWLSIVITCMPDLMTAANRYHKQIHNIQSKQNGTRSLHTYRRNPRSSCTIVEYWNTANDSVICVVHARATGFQTHIQLEQ